MSEPCREKFLDVVRRPFPSEPAHFSQAPERLAREARFEAGTYEPASATKVSASLAHALPPVRSLSPTFLLVGSDNRNEAKCPVPIAEPQV